MWLQATRFHLAFPTYGRFWTTGLSPSHRGTTPSWWPEDGERPCCRSETTPALLNIYCGKRSCYHFSKDAPQTPDVNGRGVIFAAQENFWCSVPKCDNLENVENTISSSKRPRLRDALNRIMGIFSRFHTAIFGGEFFFLSSIIRNQNSI